MDIPFLRQQFLTYRDFLHFLYANNPRKNANKITKATDIQLSVLIKICHLISLGRISIRRSDFESLKNSKRLNLFTSHFNRRDSFLSILKAPKEIKVKELKKFSALFPHLLYTMFNKE